MNQNQQRKWTFLRNYWANKARYVAMRKAMLQELLRK